MTRLPVPARRPLRSLGFALVVGLALQGCNTPGAGSSERGSGGKAEAAIPPGAIPIGDELYQVPIGADDDGCPRYRLHSPTRLVGQAVYYRDRAGGFTPDRQRAHCAGGVPR